MHILLHYKLEKLIEFNQQLILQNEAFTGKAFDQEKGLITLMANIQDYFNQIGDATLEGRISQLKLHLNTSMSGIDPEKLERITRNRRNHIRIASFHCLSSLGNILEESMTRVNQILTESLENIQQVILSALQSEVLNEKTLLMARNLEDCKGIWTRLKGNDQVRLIDFKIRGKIKEQDIYIIMDKYFSSLRT